ncbi:hypothetical protein AMECASPLE_033548 [Ameca splendens]|uniref:Uncharacterized protein n=1 Tax=Ameca splendens TaxID=208324 RepID=A0ABV0YTU7_9TELE
MRPKWVENKVDHSRAHNIKPLYYYFTMCGTYAVCSFLQTNAMFATRLVKDTTSMSKKTLCSDGTTINLPGLHAERHVWRNTNTAHHPEHIIPNQETWWGQHHAAAMLFFSRDRELNQS